jgi:hypothetical protein
VRNVALTLSLVLIFMIPWEGVFNLPGLGTGRSGTAAKFMGLAVAACWVAAVVFTGRFRKPRVFHIAVSLFVLWNALSLFWSADAGRTLVQVLTWVQLLGLVFILWDLYTTRAALLAGLQAYILGTYVAIGSAVANYFANTPFYTHYQRFGPGDTNPDGFGFIVALGIPVAWYLAGSESTTKMSRWLKLVNYAYIPAAFLGIALSGTRTALIAAVPGMAFGLASLTRLRLQARVAIFLLLTSAIFIALPFVQPLRSFQRLSTTGAEIATGDLQGRTVLWREGLAAFTEHPLIGVGSNMFRSVNTVGKVAHNSFVSVLVELGLIGFTLFGIIMTIAVIQALGQPKWDSRFWLSVLAAWAVGASTLTFEYRKPTWLFLSLVIASAALTSHRDRAVALVQRDKTAGQGVWQTG